MRYLATITCTIALAVVSTACSTSNAEPLPPGFAPVISIVDGDTVVIDLDGTHERVRLLGIDTPETSHPTRPVECFGAESTARITELIPPGTILRLERDTEARDHYGRLLLYLYRASDDLFVNHTMVAEGYATTLHIDPNRTHRANLSAAEHTARQDGLGLWGTCGGPGVAIDPLASR